MLVISAEILADIALCPWEALKVRMQTATTPFATSTVEGFNKILKHEGISGSVYVSYYLGFSCAALAKKFL